MKQYEPFASGLKTSTHDNRIFSIFHFQIQRELSEWGLSFARDLINCRGRNIADNVKIESGDRSINIRDSNWTRNLDSES